MRRHRFRWLWARAARWWSWHWYQVQRGRWALHVTRRPLYVPLELLMDHGLSSPAWLVSLIVAIDKPLLRAMRHPVLQGTEAKPVAPPGA